MIGPFDGPFAKGGSRERLQLFVHKKCAEYWCVREARPFFFFRRCWKQVGKTGDAKRRTGIVG